MNTKLRFGSTVAAALILAGCAATGGGTKPTDGKSAAVAKNPGCLTETGSRIAANDSHCSAPGRSYTSDDIDRTGATTAAGALRLMDPSITVHQ